jgi:uncharacterized cupredoxin-like copper-binding protein
MKRSAALLTALLLFAVSACQPGAPTTTINLEMTDFAFTPNQFTVQAGETITLNIEHHGIVVHEFILMKPGTSAGEHFDEEDLPNVYALAEVEPEHSQTFTFTAPSEPGEYQIVCGIAGHLEAGMTGTLIVVQ